MKIRLIIVRNQNDCSAIMIMIAITIMIMIMIKIMGNLAMVASRRGTSHKASKPLRVRSSQPPVSEMTETERKKVQVASAAR